jgi:hypothetical protein
MSENRNSMLAMSSLEHRKILQLCKFASKRSAFMLPLLAG